MNIEGSFKVKCLLSRPTHIHASHILVTRGRSFETSYQCSTCSRRSPLAAPLAFFSYCLSDKMEKLRLAHEQLTSSTLGSPDAEIVAFRFVGVSEAAVKALKLLHVHSSTFGCRNTCLYLLELGLDWAEIRNCGLWLSFLESSQLCQGIMKEVHLRSRSSAVRMAADFLGVLHESSRLPREQLPVFDYSELVASRFHGQVQDLEYCKSLLCYFDSL